MFNKRGLGRIHRKENSFNQDQINLAPLLANQVSLIVQVNYIDLLKSWFHWKKATTVYRLWNNQSWFRQTSTPPPPPFPPPPTTTHPPKKSSDLHESHGWSRAGLGGRAPPAPPRGYATDAEIDLCILFRLYKIFMSLIALFLVYSRYVMFSKLNWKRFFWIFSQNRLYYILVIHCERWTSSTQFCYVIIKNSLDGGTNWSIWRRAAMIAKFNHVGDFVFWARSLIFLLIFLYFKIICLVNIDKYK